MAIPCTPGVSPQSAWIVFSAPEMTTVSKPKRNPASAEVRDQKKIRPFIVEKGGAYHRMRSSTSGFDNEGLSVFNQWKSFFPPATNAPVHRNCVRVAHL